MTFDATVYPTDVKTTRLGVMRRFMKLSHCQYRHTIEWRTVDVKTFFRKPRRSRDIARLETGPSLKLRITCIIHFL